MSLLQKVKSGMGSPNWSVLMVDIHLQKLLWAYCPGHAGVKGNDRADRLAGKATFTSGLLTSTFKNSCGCTALDMPEWRETTEQTDWQAKQPSQVACFSENLKCWEAWDTTCRHKAKDITPSTAWRSEAWKEEAPDDLPWKDERGPSSIRLTLEPFQRQCQGNFWETGRSACGLFWVHRYHPELNWTESLFYASVGGAFENS